VTRHLDELESRELIIRRPDDDDRRALVVDLTTAAVDRLTARQNENRRHIERLLSRWTAEEHEMFGRLLPRLARQSPSQFRRPGHPRTVSARQCRTRTGTGAMT
jgi:DNA-binding MarR family transcriptional regulator